LRPPPAKYYGLEDTEISYRQRYLDLIANPEVKDVMLKRSEIIREIRNFLHGRGYVEVETPMMQAIPGGAAAQPFKTHHKALGCDFYMRIALELPLKRMLVGGVDKVFEIGRVFRNEGLSRKHNPEFTMLEAYQAFGDYETMMETVEELITRIAKNVFDTLIFPRGKFVGTANDNFKFAIKTLEETSPSLPTDLISPASIQSVLVSLETIRADENRGFFWTHAPKIADQLQLLKEQINAINQSHLPSVSSAGQSALIKVDHMILAVNGIAHLERINLTPPWPRPKYKDLIREKAGADWFDISAPERRQRAHNLGAEIGKEYEDFEVTGAVFEKLIEPTLIQPTFVTHVPKELVPLAKLSPEDPTTVEVFECCINGQEIAPAYTEQNDPIEQRERLEHQAGGEQQKLDEDFLVALEHGMPPAGGMGMGIDRLCMMLLGQESIRDVILFPQLKPKS
jgi:lysyl-tRNA synthetase, class II